MIDCLQDPQVIIDKGNFTLKLALHLLNIFSKGDRNIFTCFLEVCLPVFIQKLLPSLQDYDQEENDPILKLINYLQDLITFKNVTNVTNWLTKVSSEIPNLINSLIFLPSERTESLILHTDKDTCKLYFDKSLFSSEAEVKKSSVLELLERKTDELIYSFLLFEFFNKLHVLSED